MNRLTLILGLLLAGALVSSGVFFNKYNSVKKEYDNNMEALRDTIHEYKGKNGELVAEKTLLRGDINTLKAANQELTDQLNSMKVKNPSQVVYVETEVVNEVHDTTYIVDHTLPYQRKDFNFSNNFRQLEGFMELNDNNLGLNITKDVTLVDYTLAIKDNKVYLSSSNPYVQYNEIQGLTVPKPKKPKFSIGFGPQFGVGYDLLNNKPGIYAGVGISANYNLVSF